MVMMKREKVEARGVAELCGGGAISVEWVWGDGAVLVESEPDAEGEGEGASTVTLSFWPLLQWPEKGQEKYNSPGPVRMTLAGPILKVLILLSTSQFS